MNGLKTTSFFYDVLSPDAKRRAFQNERPSVGYFCNVVPEEMILACGAVPMRLCCLDAACAKQGEQIMPAEICPMVKSILGALENSLAGKPALIVVPGTCDNKAQLYQQLNKYASVYFLDLPRENDYLKNCAHWVEQFQSFYLHLRGRLKVKPTREDLLKACLSANKRTAVFRRMEELRAKCPQLINIRDYFAVVSASFYLMADEWTRHAELVLREAEKMRSDYMHDDFNVGRAGQLVPPLGSVGQGCPTLPSRKKVLLAGAPIIYPYFKILEILDEAGCDVACDTLCSAHGRLSDPVVIDEETEEGIVRALALKHVAASMCPCFLSINKVIEHVFDRVKTLGLDGVVFHSLRLCHLFDVQAQTLRQALKSANIPFLVIKSDLGGEDIGQIRTRVEAFREMLE